MKNKRQKQILELINNKICLTQEDLQAGLRELGFDVTQSTISRDIRELKLVKGRDSEGNYRYISNSPSKTDRPHHALFTGSVKSIKYSLNNVVIKCGQGLASSACVAIDDMFSELMLGSLAGDDTIIIVTESEEKSKELCEALEKLL